MFTAAELSWYKAGALVRQPRLVPGEPNLSSIAHAMASPPMPNPDFIVDTGSDRIDGEIDGGTP
ncbi:hypothetical protein SEA_PHRAPPUCCINO_62 [Mycobacterium phage Phrappuccino]|uniref:Uncharacterized protein n=1 Tax=Mycobacterium phage Phrappuccino TaxID=2591223 RepID=A0A514DDQ8_9CAUD|nr:hypothetical protein KHQ87_gp062 [Mycobacterium phage Phrappuccino]QDH91737.1 hypothetical protein SEA_PHRAPPUCCINO_62 [Mycobacterium phage Phrappuccino]QIQ63180.1 hypothetical protein SEA_SETTECANDELA_62 [Mycobacterium phage Settecandela]